MNSVHRKALVTGGTGFIGSHLVDRLMREGWDVAVIDNLTVGSLNNIRRWLDNTRFKFIQGDLKDAGVADDAVAGVGVVFHFAANPEVRVGATDPSVHFQENLVCSFNVLGAMRRSETAKTLVFASTSTVYGEASVLPTPESYGPLVPISTYGASKLGCEGLACSYAWTFGLRALILRFANVVGPRSGRGVIVDFIEKLRADPMWLEILGDGTQKKSYLWIDDCIEAVLRLTLRFLESKERVEIFNVGSDDQVTVGRIGEIVVEEMGLRDVKFVFTGGVDGGRGWRGDVKIMHLSIEKLLEAGWKPKFNSEQAVRLAVQTIMKEK
ncbi:SDR family NAD(P)-dependent oxidoreductase [Candidatus Bathyarchaeota archaeon]|nr:MAG: SDR family NAD(P)-dependent oxidoreductase [Candidatus Bathyarchaeota archaeon]